MLIIEHTDHYNDSAYAPVCEECAWSFNALAPYDNRDTEPSDS